MTVAARQSGTGRAAGAAVRVDGLVKRYGGRTVLDGVAFEVAAGEVFALLGPNGAGKTTTVEIIEGYRRADGGSVVVLGKDPARGGRALRARVGLMLQGGGLDPRARPRELLRLYARLHADPRDPEELLNVVGLRTVARTPVRRLSGGERQRLGLALALVGQPELAVLDEPTAGMDPAARAVTRDLVRGLRDEGVTVLLTTHDLVDVERLADRVAILHRGKIVALGTPAEVAASGRALLRVRFARSIDSAVLQGALAARWPRLTATVDATAGEAIVVTGVVPDPILVAALAAWAAEHGTLITELRAGAGLEDRYLELTGDRDVARSHE
ncbi:MAG: ABC transporter ATP-binding protein [Chloroflexota bacterium]|nr:ABC transporter ATP-binding protein [Chloroflexota bacterium]